MNHASVESARCWEIPAGILRNSDSSPRKQNKKLQVRVTDSSPRSAPEIASPPLPSTLLHTDDHDARLIWWRKRMLRSMPSSRAVAVMYSRMSSPGEIALRMRPGTK